MQRRVSSLVPPGLFALVLLGSSVAHAADDGGTFAPGAKWFVALVALVVLVLGAWLGKVFVLPQPIGVELSWPGRIRRAVGAIVVAVAGFVLVTAPGLNTEKSDWGTDFEAGLAQAEAEGKPIIIDAWADWCAACKVIYSDTLEHPDVKERLSGFVKIKLDMDKEENEPLYDRYGFDNLPWVAVFESAEAARAEGAKPQFVVREAIEADEFLARMEGKAGGDLSIGDWLVEKGLVVTLLLIFVGGVLVSFTPCVLPVYILTVNVIGARQTSSLMGRLGLSSVYVLGLALTYSVLGVLAGLTSFSMGEAFRNPAVVGAIAGLFILLALFYLEIFRLPQAGGLAARITQSERSNVATAFLLGMAGGLIAAPCVGPMLLGILTYISTQQDAWLGFWMMFTFALGMGLLFLLIGTSTAVLNKVRQAGSWGYRLEMLFAVVFLAIGWYYLRQAAPPLKDLVPLLAGVSPF